VILDLRGTIIARIGVFGFSGIAKFLRQILQCLRLGLALPVVLVDVVPQQVTKFVPRLVCRPVKFAGEDSRVPTKVNFVDAFSRRRQRLPTLLSSRVASTK